MGQSSPVPKLTATTVTTAHGIDITTTRRADGTIAEVEIEIRRGLSRAGVIEALHATPDGSFVFDLYALNDDGDRVGIVFRAG